MKNLHIFKIITTLGLMAWGTLGANAANVLFNGNLDITAIGPQNNPTPVGWSVDAARAVSGGNFDGCSSEPWCNVQDPDGFGLFFKPFAGQVGDEITVHFYQDNPATPGTKYTLSGYAAGEANYSGFFTTNSPLPHTLFVIQFLDNSSSVIASNGFDLVAGGLPNTGPGSMSSFQYITPQVTAPAGTVTVRAGASMVNTYSTSGGQSFFVDGFDLESVAPPGSPVITNQPSGATPLPGGTGSFTVGVSNTAGVSYQWQKDNANLSDGGNISGATTKTLTISSASGADIAQYRVIVSNGSGSAYSQTVPLALQSINFYPVVEINGKIGSTYRVDYSTAVAPTTWIPLRTNTLATVPAYIIDSGSPGSNTRFYRSVFLY